MTKKTSYTPRSTGREETERGQCNEDADEHEAILAAVVHGRPGEAERLTRRHVAAAITRSAL